MNQLTKFVCDFVSFFVFILASLVTFIVELAANNTPSGLCPAAFSASIQILDNVNIIVALEGYTCAY